MKTEGRTDIANQKPLPPLAPTEAWRKLVIETCGPEDDDRENADTEQEKEESDVQSSQTLDGMIETRGMSY